jgi:hypothetical protein
MFGAEFVPTLRERMKSCSYSEGEMKACSYTERDNESM